MKIALLLALAACSAGGGVGGGDDYQIMPGGTQGPTSSGGGGDAGAGDAGNGDGGVMVSARVCLLDDLRKIGRTADCAAGAAGFNVRLDGKLAVTGTDGSFQIPAPVGSDAVWKVDSGNDDLLVTTFMPFGTQTLIPVITLQRFRELQAGSSVTLPAEGAGSVLIRVLKGSAPLANVTGKVTGVTDAVSLYDGVAADSWDNASTGAAGLVWLAGVAANANGSATPGAASLTAGTTTTPLSITVWDQAITFQTKVLQ